MLFGHPQPDVGGTRDEGAFGVGGVPLGQRIDCFGVSIWGLCPPAIRLPPGYFETKEGLGLCFPEQTLKVLF